MMRADCILKYFCKFDLQSFAEFLESSLSPQFKDETNDVDCSSKEFRNSPYEKNTWKSHVVHMWFTCGHM